VVGQRTLGPEGQDHEQACIHSDLFPGWHVLNEIAEAPSFHKFQQFIN